MPGGILGFSIENELNPGGILCFSTEKSSNPLKMESNGVRMLRVTKFKTKKQTFFLDD